MQVIPFNSDLATYEFATTLEGDDYVFSVHWNERDGAWFFDVATADLVQIATGVKIVLGVALGAWVDHPLFRRGMVRALDTSGSESDAGRWDLGARVKVVRYRLDEVIALLATSGATAGPA